MGGGEGPFWGDEGSGATLVVEGYYMGLDVVVGVCATDDTGGGVMDGKADGAGLGCAEKGGGGKKIGDGCGEGQEGKKEGEECDQHVEEVGRKFDGCKRGYVDRGGEGGKGDDVGDGGGGGRI